MLSCWVLDSHSTFLTIHFMLLPPPSPPHAYCRPSLSTPCWYCRCPAASCGTVPRSASSTHTAQRYSTTDSPAGMGVWG